jgi:hypothetical protein
MTRGAGFFGFWFYGGGFLVSSQVKQSRKAAAG